MNILPRTITSQWLAAGFDSSRLKERWNALLAADSRHAALRRRARKQNSGMDPASIPAPLLRCVHYLLYAALRGKDWRKGFAPCTDANRLANGYPRWASATAALLKIHSGRMDEQLLAPFGDVVTPETLSKLRTLLPGEKSYLWQADLDSQNAYNGEAARAIMEEARAMDAAGTGP